MKQQKSQIFYLLLATLIGTSCSTENDPITPINPANDPDAIELGITAGVSLTKSAVNGGAQSGSSSEMKSLAVYAVGGSGSSSYTSGNNYAIYTSETASWTRSGETDKIYLTSEVATIYAYHPAYQPTTGGVMIGTEALKINGSGDPAATSTVNISVFEGSTSADTNNKYPTDIDNAEKTFGSSWDTNSNKDKIISAPGEIDYMYAVKNGGNGTDAATASNGKKESGSPEVNAHQVSLDMKHALSMVSFRIYNDGTYTNTGSLTKIVLSNQSGTALSKGTTPTMKISDGSITEGTASAATYTRFIDGGYTIIKKGSVASATAATTEDDAKAGSKKFSILVLPNASAVAKNTIQVTFTIDNAEYTVPLASNGTSVQWKAGENYLYTVKLSGKELSIQSVNVSAWTAATGGTLDIN